MIEAWGGGTRMIFDECAAAGLPEPAFEQVQGFRVTFRKAPSRTTQEGPSTTQAAPKYHPSSGQVPDK